MSAKPSVEPGSMKPEEVIYDLHFESRLEIFLDQLDVDRSNQLLRDAFGNELAFLDVPENIDFLDDAVVTHLGSGDASSPLSGGSRLQAVEQMPSGEEKPD